MGKAIIYVRVSDPRQVSKTSLETQEASCREWCERKGIDVARVFIERGESAKTADRTEFQKMFQYLEQEHSRISYLVVYRFDRFSRNTDETGVFKLALKAYGITLCSVAEPTDNTPSGRFLETVLGATAQLDNDVRSERSLGGMKASAKSGRWVWVAPLGYRNCHAKGEPSLIRDPERHSLVVKFFEMVASGEKAATALAHVNALGLRTLKGKPVPLWTAMKQLRNPLYCGRVEPRKWGTSVKGDFLPIVSEDLFQRVQDVLAGRSPKVVPHRRQNEEFPLRGVLLCHVCGLPATGSRSKGKTRRYRYYHCHRGRGHLRVGSDRAEIEFLALLDRLQPHPDRMRLLDEIFRRVWKDKQATAYLEARQLESELHRLEARKSRIVDLMADGALGKEDSERPLLEVKAQLQEVKSKLIYAERSVIDVDTALSYLNHLFWNSRILWETSDLRGKQRLARLIFPEGIVLSKDGFGDRFGTPVTHSIYTLLADESVGEGEVVRPERFELPT
jgi:site-specific DNA recombinase